MQIIVLVSGALASEYADSTTTTTTEQAGPPNPYIFSYTAGRYPGHADRTHTEVSNGQGLVKGSYSYVDPLQQIRTVDYVADENGFRPTLSHQPVAQQPSAAVRRATERHATLYAQIAANHAQPPLTGAEAELAALAAAPRDSASVAYAKQKHYLLFDQIAAEHERIGAEQHQARLAFEATSVIPMVFDVDE